MTVVDASVAIKWLFPEAAHTQARELLESEEILIAPSLIRIEVTGAVLRRFREKAVSDAEARSACGLWEKILASGALRLIPFEEVFDAAVDIAFKARHGLPDCLYLAVAERHADHVVTADKLLFERGRLVYPKVALLNGTHRH